MPIFRRGSDDETYNEKSLREARRQREVSGRDVERENRRTGGRGNAAERRVDARDEEDLQHIRGWLQGGAKSKDDLKKVVSKPTSKDLAQAKKNQRERDRQDAERTRKERRQAAQQSATQDKKQAREALAASNKDIAKAKDANIKGYADKAKGRKIENERARLAKKYGQGSKQVQNYGKKNPPPAPKKKGFWS